MDKTIIELKLQNIANRLLINGTLVDCPGLLHGKMGIAVFFFHYARHTGNRLFEDYGIDLIEEVQKQLYVETSVYYERGLAGIGVGIEYLAQNGFIKLDDDILDDFDHKITQMIVVTPDMPCGLLDGMEGMGRYLKCRMDFVQQKKQDPNYQRIQESFVHIQRNIEERAGNVLLKADALGHLGNTHVGNLMRWLLWRENSDTSFDQEINTAIEKMTDAKLDEPVSMGLLNGLAGEGLCLLFVFNKQNTSWIHLL